MIIERCLSKATCSQYTYPVTLPRNNLILQLWFGSHHRVCLASVSEQGIHDQSLERWSRWGVPICSSGQLNCPPTNDTARLRRTDDTARLRRNSVLAPALDRPFALHEHSHHGITERTATPNCRSNHHGPPLAVICRLSAVPRFGLCPGHVGDAQCEDACGGIRCSLKHKEQAKYAGQRTMRQM